MKPHLVFLALAATLISTTFLSAQPGGDGDEALADQVRKAIDKGVSYLKGKQNRPEGSWTGYINTKAHTGGPSALAVLALLTAGVRPDDDAVKEGLNYLRTLENPTTYVRALQTMAFVEAHIQSGSKVDLERINNNVKHFRENAVRDANGKLLGWRYDYGGAGKGSYDNSNTQYALLALWVARQADIKIDPTFWEEVREFYARGQGQDGGWGYSQDGDGGIGPRGSTLTMTAAGVCGLLMAQMEMNADRKKEDPVAICGIYKDNVPLVQGLQWVGKGFHIELPPRTYYNLYGIERLGRLSGMRFFGTHDWYREGCAWIVQHQNQDGYWASGAGDSWDSMKTVSTSFALLFLSKGRTPVLISKIAHGPIPRLGDKNDRDWDRRRNDLRHLVDFASNTIFKKMPLAWQNFDMMRTGLGGTPKVMDEIAADLLQSPIAYLTGHENVFRRLKESEKEILKKFVENGGFLLAVACCGASEFDKGFHEFCREMFGKELEPLDVDHPVWNMRFEVKPFSFGLKGLQMGCKTVVIYAPENMCGYWELNRNDDKGVGETAFHLGANIIAYATGLEAPKPRLTKIDITPTLTTEPKRSVRESFKIGQLIGTDGKAKWTPAPEAMKKLAQHLRDVVGLDVVIRNDLVPIADQGGAAKGASIGYKFLYMHGRHDFKFKTDELKDLRFNLQNGGLLLADACCGKEAFDVGFRKFIADLFPKERLEDIPFDDALFSKELNRGEALTDANIRLRTKRGDALRPALPRLEGVKIGKRWVVIYSKYDIGCALEQHSSADCLGYSYDSAVRLSRAAVLYLLTP